MKKSFLEKRIKRLQKIVDVIIHKATEVYLGNSQFRIFGITYVDIAKKEFNLDKHLNKLIYAEREFKSIDSCLSFMQPKKFMLPSSLAYFLREEYGWNFKAGKEYSAFGEKQYGSTNIYWFLKDENGIVVLIDKLKLVGEDFFGEFERIDAEKSSFEVRQYEKDRKIEKHINPKVKGYRMLTYVPIETICKNPDSKKWF